MRALPTSLALLGTALTLSLGVADAAAEEWKRGTLETVPFAPGDEVAPHGGISKILYINRCAGGCVITAASTNNALTEESTIPVGTEGQQFTLVEFAHGDTVWNEMMQCLREIYGPYDVMVTDVDPGQVPHHEAKAAGAPGNLALPGSIGGIAPSGCEPRNNVISFSFLNTYPASEALEMCATVGQESSHSFGLGDHAFDCTDPMTYLEGCGQKFFRNKLMPCGEFVEAPCNCSGTRVNSHVLLLSAFGEGTPPDPPEVTITRPLADAVITDSSTFIAAADDPRGVYKVELYLNGWLWDSYTAPTAISPPYSPPPEYLLEQPGNLPDGVIDVEIRASNDLGIEASASITVTKGAACSDAAADCLPGQACDDGRCFWAEPSGELGDECTYAEFCRGPEVFDGRCESDGESSICTRGCFVGVNDDCPDTFSCLETNASEGTGVCWPDSEDTGCCSTGDTGKGQLAAQLTMMGLVGALVLRRRRRK